MLQWDKEDDAYAMFEPDFEDVREPSKAQTATAAVMEAVPVRESFHGCPPPTFLERNRWIYHQLPALIS